MTIKESLMAMRITNPKTRAKIGKAIKALSKTQKKPPTEEEFLDDATDTYIALLIQEKYIKSI